MDSSQVISIDLYNNTLMGSIPLEVGLLSNLGKYTITARKNQIIIENRSLMK
jgi:hypothetical protein